ncbi:hypothetical protein CYMTET_35914, partial [Cymbomonas tetramitiformis]
MLSGGQKARVALARAAYVSDAAVYCLDDCLTALDVHVSQRVFDKCLGPAGLLRSATRILVTRDERFLAGADRVLVVDREHSPGLTSDSLPSHPAALPLSSACKPLPRPEQVFIQPTSVPMDAVATTASALQGTRGNRDRASGSLIAQGSGDVLMSKGHNALSEDSEEDSEVEEAEGGIIGESITAGQMHDEKKAEGSVKMEVYWRYLRQVSLATLATVVFAALITAGCEIGIKLWLAYWARAQREAGTSDFRLVHFIVIYSAFALMNTVVDASKDLFFRVVQYMIGKGLHRGMIESLMRSTSEFFEKTPSGVVTNRVAGDTGTADTGITFLFAYFVTDTARLMTTVCFIAASSPFTLMFIFPAAIGYVLAQRLYLPASRDLNRLIAVTRSPILTIFTEALAGSAFIRASALRKHLQRESELRMGAALRPTFALYHVNETSAILNDVIGAVVVAAVIFLT